MTGSSRHSTNSLICPPNKWQALRWADVTLSTKLCEICDILDLSGTVLHSIDFVPHPSVYMKHHRPVRVSCCFSSGSCLCSGGPAQCQGEHGLGLESPSSGELCGGVGRGAVAQAYLPWLPTSPCSSSPQEGPGHWGYLAVSWATLVPSDSLSP